MFAEFYKLHDLPFQLGPDPRFFFNSSGHSKAMAYLTYGLEQGDGFIVVTGEVGAGKTTLIQHLLDTLDSSKYVAVKVVTTQLGAEDTLRLVAASFGIDAKGADKSTLLERLAEFLASVHGSGKRSLLIVDEVQNLSLASLEELRMLSNFQLDRQIMLQSVLMGQPQFRAVLASQDLEQLRQRVIAAYHLGPLSADETRAYIEHRLHTVGWQDDPKITDPAFGAIYRYTGGVPRKINTLCTRLLLLGYLEESHQIDGPVVEQVAEELFREVSAVVPEAAPNDVYEVSKASLSPIELTRRVRALEKRLRNHDAKVREAFAAAAVYLDKQKNDR